MEQLASPITTMSAAVVAPSTTSSAQDRQRAILSFGRRSSNPAAASTVLQDTMALLVETFGAELGFTAWVRPEGQAADFRACQVDTGGAIVDVLSRTIATPVDQSALGMALEQQRPLLVREFRDRAGGEDPLLAELAVTSGLLVPLSVDDKSCAAVGVFQRRAREFDANEVDFAETIAHLAAAVVGRARAEQRLQQQQTLSNAVFDSLDHFVVMLNCEGMVNWLNRTVEQTTGLAVADVSGRPFAELFATGADGAAVSRLLRQLTTEAVPMQTNLSRKDGTHLLVEWNFQPILLGDGTLDSIVATGKVCLPDRAGLTPAPAAFSTVDTTAVNKEMRRNPRRSFKFRQAIAPMYGNVLPSPTSFFEVHCIDISASGVSFYLSQPPDFTTLLVALGREPKVTCFTARVARVSEVHEDGQPRYTVGCQFIGRIHL